MREFKTGDKVRRIGPSNSEVKEGDIYTVEFATISSVYLFDCNYGYDKCYFKLVESDDFELIEIL